MPCCAARSSIWDRNRRRSASSTPTPVPAFTISPASRPARPANGATESAACLAMTPGRFRIKCVRCSRRISTPSPRSIRRASSPSIPVRRRIVRAMLRRQDRLIACELEPKAAAALTAHLRGDPRAKSLAIDGWTALAAYVPPKERRGLVLIDPPFEQPDEFSNLTKGLETAHRKWPTGSYLLWYPIKDAAEVASFARRLAGLRIGKMLRVELILPTASEHWVLKLGFARQRTDLRQPAMDLARRIEGAVAGAARRARPRQQRFAHARLAER